MSRLPHGPNSRHHQAVPRPLSPTRTLPLRGVGRRMAVPPCPCQPPRNQGHRDSHSASRPPDHVFRPQVVVTRSSLGAALVRLSFGDMSGRDEATFAGVAEPGLRGRPNWAAAQASAGERLAEHTEFQDSEGCQQSATVGAGADAANGYVATTESVKAVAAMAACMTTKVRGKLGEDVGEVRLEKAATTCLRGIRKPLRTTFLNPGVGSAGHAPCEISESYLDFLGFCGDCIYTSS